MLKRLFSILLLSISCTMLFALHASANTVEVRLENIGDLEISGFQLFFFEPDESYDYPLDVNNSTLDSDFEYDWGDAQSREDFWELLTALNIDDAGTPDDDSDDIEYARGIAGSVTTWNTILKLGEGLIVSMVSEDTLFGIDLSNSSNAFYDFSGDIGEDITNILSFEESWDGDKQIITVSAIPIPSALLLLSGGLLGMISIRRKTK